MAMNDPCKLDLIFTGSQVLEMTGIWPAHTNVEKYIMGLRDKFPVEVSDSGSDREANS